MNTSINFHTYTLNSLAYSRLYLSSEYNKPYPALIDFVLVLCVA